MIRVLVVDDSEICSELLADQLEEDGDITVVDTASSGHEALEKLAPTNPDVVTVDLNMPGMDGLTLIEAIMSKDPRPIIVVTGLNARERDLAVAATERGALELVNKVGIEDLAGSAAIRASVRRLAKVAVSRVEPKPSGPSEVVEWPEPKPGDRNITPIVGFGSSAGGPKALFEILDSLPSDIPATLAVAHHLPPDFVSAFARLLRSRVHFEVVIAHEPVKPEPGLLVLAPGGCDLVFEGGKLLSDPAPDGTLTCPRINELFETLAKAPGAHVGVVLSGLGDDGARGLAAMRAADKLTIVQHRATATVWGMPRAALGAAIEILNTHEIDNAISRWVEERVPKRGTG